MAIAIKLREYVTVPVLLLAIVSIAKAQSSGASVVADDPATSRHVSFVFIPDQSTVFQSRELADVYETYSIEGTLELAMDYQARTASFVRVDANLVGDSPFPPSTRSLNELFNMTQLTGHIFTDGAIFFVGSSADGTDSEIQLVLIFTSGKVQLQGGFTPPCCDLFSYDMFATVNYWHSYAYAGGIGEPNDPYVIYTAEQMNAVGANPDDWDKHFKLMADIDLSACDGKGGRPAFNVIAPDTDASQYDLQGTRFTGVFDGNGHTISHLTVTGKDYVGLFGCVSGEVKNLGVVDVRITGSGSCVGGLVGWNYGNVTNCYSTGAVMVMGTGTEDYVGGLVGENGGTVTQCYSTGAVSGSSNVGGLVGRNYGNVTNCYSTGAVSGTGEGVGGLVGINNRGAVIACVWDTQTSGQAKSDGGTGLTTAEMRTASTFRGWGGCGPLWTIDEGRGYPHLAWENAPGEVIAGPTYGGGTGTTYDPYLIYTPEELNSVGLAVCHWDKHFKLMADIDLSGFDGKEGRPAFDIIGTSRGDAFTGVFDGNGHTVSHLTIKGHEHYEYVGLFGYIGSEAEVRELGVVDANIAGSYDDYVGGLVGSNEGTVTQCYSTGAVSNLWYAVGGLVGANGGSVTQCYSTGAVSGTDWAGGLVGENYGHVTNCYSTGAVSNLWYGVGGLVGGGTADRVTDCFWDTQSSGQAVSAGGTGKTTAEMQAASTFLDAGWDFVDETANGREDIWWILEGKDYPRLWWETAEK